MKNLTNLRELTIEEITKILDRAEEFKKGDALDLSGKVIGNLFFEPSTRTMNSFIMAQKKLKIEEITLNPETSSLKKGESLYDTVKTFESIGVNAVVIRATEDKYYDKLIGHINIPIINGGDGSGDHPTQSLLDLMTIREEFGKFSGLKVLIMGDIRYSRVARTNIEIMRRLGMEVTLSAPEELRDPAYTYIDEDSSFEDFDIIMLLRVQHERHPEHFKVTQVEYLEKYGLNDRRYDELKESAIIMHPAPFNRGWEIKSELVESKKARIFKQMENGVFTRMAVIERSLEEGIWKK